MSIAKRLAERDTAVQAAKIARTILTDEIGYTIDKLPQEEITKLAHYGLAKLTGAGIDIRYYGQSTHKWLEYISDLVGDK